MKKILFIGGILPEQKIDEIIKNSKKNIDFAAHNFQKKVLMGLNENEIDYDVLSVPFISSFPKYYKKIEIRNDKIDNIKFCSYTNLPYYKIVSRYISLKKNLKQYLKTHNDFNVIIYSLHFPFIKNAKLLKKKNKDCKITLIVPDLQEYMSDSKNIIYRILKKIEIKKTNKYLQYIDNFVFLTEFMNDRLNKLNKPHCVVEGISENITNMSNQSINKLDYMSSEYKYFAYTGTLAARYGIMHLVNAFLNTKQDNIKLIICGQGEMANEIKRISLENDKIIFKGLVSPKESKEIQMNAFALINPRMNNEEYTKYSFPSKIMEYISTGKPVICYRLDGFPSEYDDVLIYPKGDTIQDLSYCIDSVSSYDKKTLMEIQEKSLLFLQSKDLKSSAKKIISFFE